MTKTSLSLGIDIGGTFTDIVVYSQVDGLVFSHKELTTPRDPTEGAIRGIRTLFERERISAGRISRVIHATSSTTAESSGACLILSRTIPGSGPRPNSL